MVKIFIWQILELPAQFSWLAPWLSLLLTAVFWMVVAFFLRLVILAALRWLSRRTETDIDDVILDATSPPLFALVLLLGLYNSLEQLGFHDLIVTASERVISLIVIIIITFWVYRVFHEVVIYYGRQLAENTESNLDDVLLPIANQLGPLVIFLIGALVVLQYLGVNLESLLVAIGGLSFILAFALQDILSNIFSGLSLVVDTPFGYHDLIVLSDGTVCEVRRIGLRVTELYNVNGHSIIYMPNSQLANERLVNVTRPSPDLIDSITLSVEAEADIPQVEEILESIVVGHPDVLGDLDEKLEHLPRFAALESGEAKHANGSERLKLEQQVNAKLTYLFVELDRLANRVHRLEKGGLSKTETRELEGRFLKLLPDFGLSERDVKIGRTLQRQVDYNGDAKSLIGLVREWVTIWACDPDLGGSPDVRLDVAAMWYEPIDEPLNDQHLLVMQWNRRIRLLTQRLNALRQKFADPRGSGVEQRLDNLVRDLMDWLRKNFKEPTAKWKSPDVNFNGPDAAGLSFTLEFFIDDIELEHFERQERVQRELRREIVARLRAANISLPFPQHVVHLKSELKAPAP
jgi:MscS family membrane protein